MIYRLIILLNFSFLITTLPIKVTNIFIMASGSISFITLDFVGLKNS